jgi:hypothetical protein
MKIKLIGKYFYQLGLNITSIHNKRTEYNLLDQNIIKSPSSKWEHLKSTKQKINDFESINWENATGIGTVLGYDGLMSIDIDGCTDVSFVKEISNKIGLPPNNRWIVKSGSGIGFHLIFYCKQITNLYDIPVDNNVTFLPSIKYKNQFYRLEIRIEGHLVLPESFHRAGLKYRFISDWPNTQPPSIKSFHLDILYDYFDKVDYHSSGVTYTHFRNTNLLARNHINLFKKNEHSDKRVYIYVVTNNEDENIYSYNFSENLNFQKKGPNDIIQISWMITEDSVVRKLNTYIVSEYFEDFINSKSYYDEDILIEICKSKRAITAELFDDLIYLNQLGTKVVTYDKSYTLECIDGIFDQVGLANIELGKKDHLLQEFTYFLKNNSIPNFNSLFKFLTKSKNLLPNNALFRLYQLKTCYERNE